LDATLFRSSLGAVVALAEHVGNRDAMRTGVERVACRATEPIPRTIRQLG